MTTTQSDATVPGATQAPHPGRPAALVASLFGLTARLRHAKALHPRGSVTAATVRRSGLTEPVGVPWLDEPGEDAATVRLSRATGLPSPLPDVLGLAVRVSIEGRPADLLLSSTGSAPGLRHVLRPRRDPFRATYSSITPFRTPTGLVMVGALPFQPASFTLAVAGLGGAWRPFAQLVLATSEGSRHADAGDADIDMDAVQHPIPRLDMPEALAGLRAASYAASRKGRRSDG